MSVSKQQDQYKTKAEFLALLAHELRNPLATILSSVELVEALGTNAEEVPSLLSVVSERVRAISTVLDNFLNSEEHTTTPYTLGQEPIAVKKRVPTIPAPLLPQNALRILIVDDNENAANSLAHLLTLRGYNVALAYSGFQGFDTASIFLPQVVILDIGMPGMDGYQLLRMLKKTGQRAVSIALTGYSQAQDKEKAREVGFDYHLTKPAGVKEIDTILKRIPLTL